MIRGFVHFENREKLEYGALHLHDFHVINFDGVYCSPYSSDRRETGTDRKLSMRSFHRHHFRFEQRIRGEVMDDQSWRMKLVPEIYSTGIEIHGSL